MRTLRSWLSLLNRKLNLNPNPNPNPNQNRGERKSKMQEQRNLTEFEEEKIIIGITSIVTGFKQQSGKERYKEKHLLILGLEALIGNRINYNDAVDVFSLHYDLDVAIEKWAAGLDPAAAGMAALIKELDKIEITYRRPQE